MARFGLALILSVWAVFAVAQTAPAPSGPTRLLADEITVTPEGVLIARGSVDILVGDTRLQAEELRFDEATEQLRIEGPIRIDEDGDTVILASSAMLDATLRDGILRDARLVLAQQLQIASAELSRRGDRYSVGYKVAATSCHVCDGTPPLWEVRAQSIVLDDEEQQLYLTGAQLRIAGVPVLWVPRLRFPAPGLERASGVLTPGVRTTTQLGTGVKIPYFFKLGDHRDFTLEPYVSAQTTTFEYRYRQAFINGDLEINGALTRDEIIADELRGYIDLRYNTTLFDYYAFNLALEGVSDEAYLLDYGVSSQDFVRADVSLTRVRQDEAVELSFGHINSLRDGDINAEIPTLALEGHIERRFTPSYLGGVVHLRGEIFSQYRYSDEDPADVPVGQDGGRDTSRATFAALWDRSWVSSGGVVVEGLAELYVDSYLIEQDRAFDESSTIITPYLGGSLAYPLVRSRDGVTTTLEPKIQLILAPSEEPSVPNEDSTIVEFDEGNLFSTSRSPGADRREQGSRINAGLVWARSGLRGTHAEVTTGRIFRFDDPNEFTDGSGAAGLSSDWLVTAGYRWPTGASFDTRVNFDDALIVAKASTQLDWTGSKTALNLTHLYLIEDEEENRPSATNELNLSAEYDLSDIWAVSGGWRYDFDARESRRADLGLTYTNECVRVGFSVSRRFTSSDILEPTTDFGLSVVLLGFGGAPAGQNPRTRSCQGAP